MKYKRISIKFDIATIAALDRLALSNYTSRTELIRRAVMSDFQYKSDMFKDIERGNKEIILIDLPDDFEIPTENKSKYIRFACQYLLNNRKKFNLKK